MISATAAGGARAEREIVAQLQRELPDSFDIFHSVDWAIHQNGQQHFGELDVVVVSDKGHLALLEVKAGELEVLGGKLVKHYLGLPGAGKDVGFQVSRQYSSVRTRLRDAGMGAVFVERLLVLPHYKVPVGSLAFPRQHIVDASEVAELAQRVIRELDGRADLHGLRARLLRFLCNDFALSADVDGQIGRVQRASKALSEGLATWVPRISHGAGVFQIQATAGSGKTQLALALLNGAAAAGKRAAYVCFNRALADHLAPLVTLGVEVATFHQRCWAHARTQGIATDFSKPGVFGAMATAYMEHLSTHTQPVDVLVVDESQDFEATWLQALVESVAKQSRVYVLGDAQQELYGREVLEIADAVRVDCQENYRTPRSIVQAINSLRLCPSPVQARSAFGGEAPHFVTYAAEAAGADVAALERCLRTVWRAGFDPEDVAVLTFVGMQHSALMRSAELMGYGLKRFTGAYEDTGAPVWSPGRLLADTVYRFKGRSAPVVVLCEVDFEELTALNLRKLFVGFTRAQCQLHCVLSERSARLLMRRVDGD